MTSDAVRYERNPHFIYRQIVDEAVLVPIHRDVADMECLYTLNPVAATIWEHLEKPATVVELQAAILEEYEVEPDTLAADLGRFLDEMVGLDALRKV